MSSCQPEPCPPNVSKSTSETGFGLFWLWVSRKRAKDAKRPRYHCAISPVGLDLGRFELPTYRNFIVKLAVHVTTTRSRDHLANNEFLSRALGHASTIPPRCPHGAALSCGSCAPRGTPADRERLLSPRSVAISHSLIPSRLTPLSYTPPSLNTTQAPIPSSTARDPLSPWRLTPWSLPTRRFPSTTTRCRSASPRRGSRNRPDRSTRGRSCWGCESKTLRTCSG